MPNVEDDMEPPDFAVPGALLRTAGDVATGDGHRVDRDEDALTPPRGRRGDGVGATVVMLALLVLGDVPVGAALVLLAAVFLLVMSALRAPARAGAEERELLARAGLDPDDALVPAPRSSIVATAQRLGTHRGIRDLGFLAVALGLAAFAVPRFAGDLLRAEGQRTATDRVTVLLVAVLAGVLLATVAHHVLGALTRDRPDSDRLGAGTATAVALGFLGLAAVGSSSVAIGAFVTLGTAATVVAIRAGARVLAATVPPRERTAAWLLVGTQALLVGGLVGTVLLDLIADGGHTRAALSLLAPLGLAAGGYVAAGGSRRTTAREAAGVVTSVRERHATAQRIARGEEPPAVEVTGVDFSFGAQPVLREVSLTVPQGEVAALLGTNGAGKSTLLRVVAGLLVPERGTVRIFGDPPAVAGPERLGERGIALVLGGGMTFPGLTVAETLRLSLLGLSDPADVDEVYGRFPVLWERRGQRTGTLSGGEQQMLAVGRALLTRPKLLLIDELTLGLAPKIVGDLVELVGELTGRGTTVVLVEQSVNIATQLATHAFFLERGQVRYDGPTDELLARDDLLRSVFLAGAAT